MIVPHCFPLMTPRRYRSFAKRLGKVEFCILFPRILPLRVWPSPRPLRFTSSVGAVPDAARARRCDPAAAQDIGAHALVLRTLIEEFGGETTSADLCRRMAAAKPAPLGWNQTPSRGWIGVALDELASCDAVELEWISETEVIARVTRDGIILAYEQPAAEIAFGTARTALSARRTHD